MKKSGKRGQVALEIIVIIGFLVLLIVPTLLQVFMTFGESQEKLAVVQADQAAGRLARTIDVVGASGINSSITTELIIPQLVTEINVADNEVVFTLQTSNGETQIVKKIDYPANADNRVLAQYSASRFTDIEPAGDYFVTVRSTEVLSNPANPMKSLIKLSVK